MLDLRQQAAVCWLSDGHGLYGKKYTVIRGTVICLSLHASGAQICAFMSLWSQTEMIATAPICFHAWQLYLLTFPGTFTSHDWFTVPIKPIKWVPTFSFCYRKVQRCFISLFFVWAGSMVFYCVKSITPLMLSLTATWEDGVSLVFGQQPALIWQKA